MKSFTAGLQASVQSSYANNGKTSLLGAVSQKTINSQQVVGAPLTQFIDVFTQTGLAPVMSTYSSATGRLFILAGVSPSFSILYYTLDSVTGAYSYVGKVNLNLPNASVTTHTVRGFDVYDSGTALHALIATTGSIVINGGLIVAYDLQTSDFVVGGTNIFAASGAGQKAMYFFQDPSGYGANNDLTTLGGACAPSSIGTKAYFQQGAAASLTIGSFDLSVSPTVAGTVTNGVNAQTTAYAGTSPNAYFTMGASQNGYQVITPSASLFEAVSLLNGSGNVPANFTAWTPGTVQTTATTVIYMRDLQQVGGNWYFNLSNTPAGAAVIPTSSTSGFSMSRSFGTSINTFVSKTGILPTLTGTILQSNSFQYTNPTNVLANPSLDGQQCLSFATSTTLYMGKLSELTSGTTTWPSLTPVTASGLTTIVAPTVTFATYSSVIDRWVYVTNTSSFVCVPHQTANITAFFGGLTTAYLEGQNPATVQFGAAALGNVITSGNWLFATSTTVGQRGILFMNIASDSTFGNASVISPVLNVPAGSTFKAIGTIEQLFDYTDSMNFYIRSATTSSDSIFSTATGGWTQIHTATDLSATAIGPFFQLMATFQIITLDANTPAQLNDFLYTVQLPGESSNNWVMDNDNTTQGNATPSYASFYLQTAYSVSVPQLFTRVYDINGNLIFSADTITSAASFQYSTNGGTSWNALGTIPNTAGTRLRVLVTPTPNTVASASIRES